MEHERQDWDARDQDSSRNESAATDHEATAFVDVIEEMLPNSDEAVRKALEEHETEGQGE